MSERAAPMSSPCKPHKLIHTTRHRTPAASPPAHLQRLGAPRLREGKRVFFFERRRELGLVPHTLIHNGHAGVCPNLLHAFPPSLPLYSPLPLCSFLPSKRQRRRNAKQLKPSNVFDTFHPFHQGKGGTRRPAASVPGMQVVRRDQELQGGGAQETRGASTVAAPAYASQDASAVHASEPVPATDPSEASTAVTSSSRDQAGSGSCCDATSGRGCHVRVPEEGGQGTTGILQEEEAGGDQPGTLLWVVGQE